MKFTSTAIRTLLVLCLSIVTLTNAQSQLKYWERLSQFPSAHTGDALSIQSILITNKGSYIVAANLGSGVYHSENRGSTWTTAKPFANYDHGYALCVNPAGDLFVVTNKAGGGKDITSISRSKDQGVTYTKTSFPDSITVNSIACSATGTIFVGTTRKGIYRTVDTGITYTSANFTLSNRPITTLLTAKNGTVYAGTDGDGLFQSTNNGDKWTLVTNDVTMNNIACLFQDMNGVLYSGTNYGVYRSVDNGKSWLEILNTGTGSSTVKSIVVSAKDKKIYAAVQGEGVYFSADNGESWTQLTSGFTTTAVSVLAIDSTGSFLVGTSQDLYRNTNAPVLSVKKKEIDFGSIKNGQIKDTSFIITNIGGSALDITGMNISGFDAADFQITMKEPVSLEPNATKTFTISCSSKKNGDKEATLVFTSNTSGLTTEVALLASVSGSNSVLELSNTTFTANLFPNPLSATSAVLRINSEKESTGELRLVSTLGTIVFASEFRVDARIPLQVGLSIPSQIANGIYQALVLVGGQTLSIPISIIR